MRYAKNADLSKKIYNFSKGELFKSYNLLGCKLTKVNNINGATFRVWSENAKEISVVGSFNSWRDSIHIMKRIKNSNIWSIFIPNVKEGDLYKYKIVSNEDEIFMKSDPYAFYSDVRPKTDSIVYDINSYKWHDSQWNLNKVKKNLSSRPLNIYELHLASWKKKDCDGFYSYKEIADLLIDYVKTMNYTHIELLPISEHPLDDSWGYQTTGYYSITSRYGTPNEFKYFIDKFHQNNIGIILDWVPGHFCKDDHGLYRFDGSHLYEYPNSLLGENYDWGTANFNLSKPEINSFLISNAVFWFDIYHIDGLRVDAVANMLYLNYGKKSNFAIKNDKGGIENWDAVNFIKKLNETIFELFSNPLMIAEESTTWPLVTQPTYCGGLGFNYKWNMGWMNDMLTYMSIPSSEKPKFHNLITFSIMYAFSENFILPLSHDEVVHGKKSLLSKMPGSYEEQFSNLRLFYGYMLSYPGKKLLFMGGEFGQFIEWGHKSQLDWHLLQYPKHEQIHKYTIELNKIYKEENALWELDGNNDCFQWIDFSNNEQSIISFIRKSKNKNDYIIVICNFSSITYENFRVGVPRFAAYTELLNSDAYKFGGTNILNKDLIHPIRTKWNNQPYCVEIKIPAFSVIYLKPKFKFKIN